MGENFDPVRRVGELLGQAQAGKVQVLVQA